MTDKIHILTDLGGTHGRFAIDINGQPEQIEKYECAQYKSLQEALNTYCKSKGVRKVSALSVATAAREEIPGKQWKFINDHLGRHQLTIDTENLASAGFPVRRVLNDFEAATWGVSALDHAHQKVLRPAGQDAPDYPRCVTGPGTGLGLAFLEILHNGKFHVRGTFGVHAPAAARTDEQMQVLKFIERNKVKAKTAVFEDVISGAGLFNIYRALCDIGGKPGKHDNVKSLFNNLADPELKETLRVFHEFFGTYAGSAFIFGHGLGGFYLTGGVMDRLVEQDAFDLKTFLQYFEYDAVDPVVKALKATKITHIEDEFVPLRGLIAAEKNGVPALSV